MIELWIMQEKSSLQYLVPRLFLANSAPAPGAVNSRNPATIKQMMLKWCQHQVLDYQVRPAFFSAPPPIFLSLLLFCSLENHHCHLVYAVCPMLFRLWRSRTSQAAGRTGWCSARWRITSTRTSSTLRSSTVRTVGTISRSRSKHSSANKCEFKLCI